MNDKQLLTQLITSNKKETKSIYEEIYLKYYDHLLYIAKKSVKQEAEDVVQTTFIKLLENRKTLKHGIKC